jgi:hypothetical protein
LFSLLGHTPTCALTTSWLSRAPTPSLVARVTPHLPPTGSSKTDDPTTIEEWNGEGVDPEEVARLEQKMMSLGRVVEEQHDGIKKLNTEVSIADCFSGSVFLVVFHHGLLKKYSICRGKTTPTIFQLRRRSSHIG